jgi:hypothetical protein
MADFNVDLNPKANQTSLSDMLKMSYYSSQADIANIEAQKAQQANKERIALQGFTSDPKNFMTENGDIDIDRIAKVVPSIAPLTGMEYVTKMANFQKNNTEAKSSLMQFNQDQRKVVAGVYSALGRAGITDPKTYMEALNNLKQAYPDSKDIHRYVDATINNLHLTAQGNHQDLPQLAIRNANQLMTPNELREAYAPKASMQEFNKVPTPVVSKPSVEGEAPTINVGQLGGTTPMETKTEAPKKRDLIKYDTTLEYTGPKAPLMLNGQQQEAYDKGRQLLFSSNAVATAAKEQEANTRGIYENLAATSGNRPGQLVRAGGKWLIGNAQLEMLNKNISRMAAASNVMNSPVTTDMARETQSVINGSSDLTAKALEDIVSRADATVKAATLFNRGYNKFIENNPGPNGYIQSHKFQSAWNDNFDLRMAQMDALATSNSPDKAKKIQEIYNTVAKDDRKDFNKRWENIHALEQGMFK